MDVDECFKSMKSGFELSGPLWRDMVEAGSRRLQDDSPFNRRTYVRAYFAFVEGWVWINKQLALVRHYLSNTPLLSEAEVALLRDEQYEVKSNGDAVIRTKFIRLVDNIRFMDKCLDKVGRPTKPLDFESPAWRALKESVEIRNRITHPRTPEDLDLSDEDMKTIQDAANWFAKLQGPSS